MTRKRQQVERDDEVVFRNADGRAFHRPWEGGGYRLERATALPGTWEVPAVAVKIGARALPRFGVIISEHRGGISTFAEWWRSECKGEVVAAMGDAVDRLRAPGQRVKPLLVDRSGAAKETEQQVQAAATLAGLVDQHTKGPPVWCLGHEVAEFARDQLYSSLAARGHVYRLPRFTHTDLVDWGGELVGKPGLPGRPEELAWWAKALVGGQPYLTHLYFARLDKELHAEPSGSASMLAQRVGWLLCQHEAHVVSRWQDAAARLLREDPSLRNRLETYARGDVVKASSLTLDDVDAKLYLAGWVGETLAANEREDSTLRWGIASRCHQRWAVNVLQRLQS